MLEAIQPYLGIIVMLSLAAIGGAARWILKGLGDLKENLDTRLRVLEQDSRQFMPKVDLEKEFDHEKANRIAADKAAEMAIRDMRSEQVTQGKQIAMLQQDGAYRTNEIIKLTTAIDKVDGKVDAIGKTLAALDKRLDKRVA